MSGATYYDGPQLTGAAIDANVFCVINPTPTPDTVIMGTAALAQTAPVAFVSSVALDSGQALYGMQDSGYAIIKCESGYTPTAGAELTSANDGEATAAAVGEFIYAIAVEPASGAAGYVRARLVATPIVKA